MNLTWLPRLGNAVGRDKRVVKKGAVKLPLHVAWPEDQPVAYSSALAGSCFGCMQRSSVAHQQVMQHCTQQRTQ